MSMKPQEISPVPEETARVARAANPKGHVYMHMRDELGSIYDDQMFVALFPRRGHPAEARLSSGPGDGDAIEGRIVRSTGGFRGARTHRLEICVESRADRSRL
jgi:hypothetical protein